MIWFLCFNGIAYSQNFGGGDSLLQKKPKLIAKDSLFSRKLFLFPTFSKNNQKAIVKISGQIRVEQQFQNDLLFGQIGPKNLTRVELSPNLEIMGLPFRSNLFLTTEQNFAYPGLNRFNIEFDYQTFINAYVNRLKEDIKANNPIKDSLNNLNKNLEIEKDRLINKRKNLKEPGFEFTDSLHLNHPEIEDSLKKKQEQFYHFYDSVSNRINQIDSILNYFDSLKSVGLFDEYSTFSDISHPFDLPNKHFKNSQFLKLFSSLRTLQLGTIFPVYHQLFLNGSQLFGLNAELINSKKWYFSGTLGFQAQRNFNSIEDNNLKDRIAAIQFGRGEIDGNFFRMGYLNGNGKLNNYTANSNDNSGNNSVYHLLAGIKISKNIQLKGAYSQSKSDIDQKFNLSEDYESNFRIYDFINNSSAVSLELDGNNEWLNYQLRYQRIGNQFFTMGNPFQRNDIRRIEFNSTKQLKKIKTVIKLSFRNDQDNLNGTKGFSNNSYQSRIQFVTKINKSWSINGSFNPTIQLVSSVAENQSTFSNTNYFSTIGSSFQKMINKKFSYVFTQNISHLNSTNSRGFNMNRFFYNGIHYLIINKNTFQVHNFYSKTEGVFGGNQINNGINYIRQIKHGSCRFGLAYNYSDILLNSLNINAGIDLIITKYTNLRLDYKIIEQKSRTSSTNQLGIHLVNIQLIQRF